MVKSSRLFFVFTALLLTLPFIKCNDEEDSLLQGINSYRASLNLTSLRKNDNAECFAEELADQFKHQPCTNSTGANTVPGTEPQFSNFEALLAKCHLNVTDTKDGAIMPACVPNLVPSLVLSNFTQSQYTQSLNDTKFTGVGIASEDNWIVVVLTTNSPGGSFMRTNAAALSKIGVYQLLFVVIGVFFL